MHAFTPAKAGAAAFWAAGVTDNMAAPAYAGVTGDGAAGVTDTIADPAFAGVTDNRFRRIS